MYSTIATNWGTGTDVNRLQLTVAMLAMSAVAVNVTRAADDYTLYEPKPTNSSTPPANPEDGLLVRNIVIQKGDTLWGLASKYRGRGSYYSQFLILNKIDDPDLIYAGKIIHVPVTPGKPVTPPPHHARKEKTGVPPVRRTKKQPAAAASPVHQQPAPKSAPVSSATVTSQTSTIQSGQSNSESEQRAFEAASRAYKTGDCKSALERFDQFLNRYPSSPLAADVSLYKADCYMKLSGQ